MLTVKGINRATIISRAITAITGLPQPDLVSSSTGCIPTYSVEIAGFAWLALLGCTDERLSSAKKLWADDILGSDNPLLWTASPRLLLTGSTNDISFGCSDDIVETILIAELRSRAGYTSVSTIERVKKHVQSHGVTSFGSSTAYRSPNLLGYLLARWFEVDEQARVALGRLVHTECLHWSFGSLYSPHETALVITTLARLGNLTRDPGAVAGTIMLLEKHLMGSAHRRGVWAPGIWRWQEGCPQGSVLLTAALALEALLYANDYDRVPSTISSQSREAAIPDRQTKIRSCTRGYQNSSGLFRPGTLTYLLDQVKVGGELPLLSSEGSRRLHWAGQRLPASLSSGLGLEFRPSEDSGIADLLVCIHREGGGRRILSGRAKGVTLDEALLSQSSWRRVRRLARLWDESVLFDRAIESLWLEFDLSTHFTNDPLPSVFFCFDTSEYPAHQIVHISEMGIECLGEPLSDSAKRTLLECVSSIPSGAQVFAIGKMLSRGATSFRLCIKGLHLQGVLPYLDRIRWGGDFDELQKWITRLYGVVDKVRLNIDVYDHVLPHWGIECDYLHRKQPVSERRWYDLFNILKRERMMDEVVAQAVLDWPGVSRVLWKLGDCLEESYLQRRLAHVKIQGRQGVPTESKLYLGVWQFLSRKWRTEDDAEKDN